jgi:hypothetical protein
MKASTKYYPELTEHVFQDVRLSTTMIAPSRFAGPELEICLTPIEFKQMHLALHLTSVEVTHLQKELDTFLLWLTELKEKASNG